jgi:hypothetical protein
MQHKLRLVYNQFPWPVVNLEKVQLKIVSYKGV